MPKIEQTPSGPVAHLKDGESLDLTEPADFDEDSVGSTARTDPKPALVDTSAEKDIPAEGDKLKPGHVSEVDKPPEVLATAGELRKAGYTVDPKYKDKDIPSSYEADTPTAPGEVHLVQHAPVDEGTAKKAKAVTKAPKNK